MLLEKHSTLFGGFLRLVIGYGLSAAVLFGSAGQWTVRRFWFYLGTFALYSVIMMVVLLLRDPDLLRERLRTGSGDADRWTLWLLRPLFVAHWVIAGLDVGRFHWSVAMPQSVEWAGLAGVIAGLAGWTWPMMVNRYFSVQVRIQAERGHHVVTSGPYQYVRHPGYVAMMLLLVASPFALGSYWSAVPAAGLLVVLIRRTALEDRFLHESLPGYTGYAERVRYRLLPGVW